jgi:enoyl-[acyl-carrier-protein] reductase (NADH)
MPSASRWRATPEPAFEAGRKYGIQNAISAGRASRAATAIGIIDETIRYTAANAPYKST